MRERLRKLLRWERFERRGLIGQAAFKGRTTFFLIVHFDNNCLTTEEISADTFREAEEKAREFLVSKYQGDAAQFEYAQVVKLSDVRRISQSALKKAWQKEEDEREKREEREVYEYLKEKFEVNDC